MLERSRKEVPAASTIGELLRREGLVQGRFLWGGARLALSPVLAEEWIGLRELEDDLMEVVYGPVLLGWLDHHTGTFVRRETAERSEDSPTKGPGQNGARHRRQAAARRAGRSGAQALSDSSPTG